MKWKLIYPKWRKLDCQTPFDLPPHGPVVFAADVPPDIELEFVDENVDPLSLDDDPDLVCLSIMLSSQVPRAVEIAKSYKNRGVSVLCGGISTMLHWEYLSQHVDSVFLGEAEGRTRRIAEDLRQNRLAPVYDYLQDHPPIETVGTARRDILNHDRYVYRGVRMLDLVHASRGCRFNCFPCCTPFLGGRKFRPRPIDKVVEEIESIDNGRLFFVDNSFAQDHNWQEELFKALIPLKKKWVCHPIEDNTKLLKLAFDAGCWYSYQAIFDTSDYIRDRVRNYQDQGIGVEGTIILGLDDHDEDGIKKLVDFLLEIELDIAEFTILTPFAHTSIRTELEQQGRILTNDLSEYTCDRVVFQPKLMSPEKLQEMYYYAWNTFYADASKEVRMGELFRKIIQREVLDGTYKSDLDPAERRRRNRLQKS